MNVLAIVMLGFAPGVFWLWLIYQRDKYIPAPAFLVVRTFLWGVAVSVPVVIVEGILLFIGGVSFGQGLPKPATNVLEIAYGSFIVAGLTEELAKFLVVRYTVAPSPYFRQPLDGIIFAAAVALGFASIENVAYMFSFGPAVIVARGPFSTLAHVFFSITWGYALGLMRLQPATRRVVPLALLASMLLHGLFDFFLFLEDPLLALGALALFAGIAAIFIMLVAAARRQSPFRDKVAPLLVRCPHCGHLAGFGAAYCTNCGRSLGLAKVAAPLACGNCGRSAAWEHAFCTRCGSRLDRRRISGVR